MTARKDPRAVGLSGRPAATVSVLVVIETSGVNGLGIVELVIGQHDGPHRHIARQHYRAAHGWWDARP